MEHAPAPSGPRFSLRVLGPGDLRNSSDHRVASVLAQPKRLCLLTYLALATEPVSRSTLAALFWPESDEARARNALAQAVFFLRRSLGKGALPASEADRLWVDPEWVWCDARELLNRAEPGSAVVERGARDLLEGWNAEDSQPLQEWLDATRRRLAARAAELDTGPPSPVAAASDDTPVTHPSPTRSRSAWGLRVAALGLAMFAGLALAFSSLELGSATPTTTPTTIVVLQPIWAAEPPPEGLEEAIVAEVLGSLHALEALQVHDASFLSPRADIGRALDAIGQEEIPELALRIVIRMQGSEIRARINLSGPLGLSVGAGGAELTFADLDELQWSAPDSIAASVLDAVLEGLANQEVTR